MSQLPSDKNNNTVLQEMICSCSSCQQRILQFCISYIWYSFSWQASVSSTSTFSQYKGELVISLKYVTPKKTTPERTKGETLNKFQFWTLSNPLSCFNSGKKSATEDGGELHVLIKEANNLISMKAAGSSDTFVKGSDIDPVSVSSVQWSVSKHTGWPLLFCHFVVACIQANQRTWRRRLRWWRNPWIPTTTTRLCSAGWLWSSWGGCAWNWLCGTGRPC